MDNSPIHRIFKSTNFFLDTGINHFKTPAQSPDFNSIELVWNDLKAYVVEIVKPNNQIELIDGITQFWNEMVSIEYCNAKINHLNRVMRVCLNVGGKATGL